MRARYLDDKELEAIRRHMGGKNWIILQVALETGLRVGDVVALRWADVQGEEVFYRAQKTGKPGVARLSAATAAWVERQRRYATSPWVFPSPRKEGAHVTRQAVWRAMKDAVSNAGVEAHGASPHSLRKTFAVRVCREAGMEATREALQHDRVSVTELYAWSDWLSGEHADEPLLRRDLPRVAEAVAEILGSKYAGRG